MRWWIRSRSDASAAPLRRLRALFLLLISLPAFAQLSSPSVPGADAGTAPPAKVGAGATPPTKPTPDAAVTPDAGSSAVDKPTREGDFGPPDDPITAQARALSDQARVAYEGGQFREAMRLYHEAYKKRPLPGFLFNIAQCHRQLGAFERAAFFYGRYLDVLPNASNAELARALLAESEQKALALVDEERKKLELEVAEAQEARVKAEQDAAAARALAARPPPPPEGVVIGPALLRNGWFWAGVAGVTAAAVGTVLIAQPGPRPTTLGTVELR